MTSIQAQWLGEMALVPRQDFQRLLELAAQADEIVVDVAREELTSANLTRLAEIGGAFQFWHEEGENIYSLQDGEPI